MRLDGQALLDAIDQTTSNYVLPLSGLLVSILVGWCWTKGDAMAAAGLREGRLGTLWHWLLRYAAPLMIGLIVFDSTGAL